MNKVTQNDLNTFNEVYHQLIFNTQKKQPDIFSQYLKDISTIEISILNIVERKPDVIIKEIIQILGIPNSTLSNAINRLETKQLIKRTISQQDKRSYGLELTEKGELAQLEHKQGEIIWCQMVLEALTKEERNEFLNSLKKIAQYLQSK